MDTSEIAVACKKFRNEKQISIRAMAEETGFPKSTIHSFENNLCSAKLNHVSKYLEMIGYELKLVKIKDPSS